MSLLKDIFRPIKDHIKLVLFRRKFRKENQFNELVPDNIFSLDNVTGGRYSYGHFKFITWGTKGEYLKIGDFVSIGANVTFMAGGNHEMNFLSTFPFKVKFLDARNEALTKGAINVQDDVWIGSNVLILSGVTIGQGAVIAAGSVVTKDVSPYKIVGGNPARVIRSRFDDVVVDALNKIDFSKMDKDWILKNKKNLEKEIKTVIDEDFFQQLK